MRRVLLGAAVALLGLGPWAAAPARGDDVTDTLFRERVAKLFEKRCLSCHAPGTAKGGLDLSHRASLLEGGDSGPAIEPGKPEESLLLELVSSDPPAMPRKGDPLTPAERADLRAWIAAGANWPEGVVLSDRRFDGETWWALAPLARPNVPMPRHLDWARTPIDAFLLARLEAEGMSPAPEADRRALLRRLSFDLTGLPPSPEEIEAFEADNRPDAYERQVDRLLASPRLGERWGRHWLDVAHYGDTHGYDKDKRRDHAWPYRDYVIRRLNADAPYGRFIREQIAGDVFWPGTADGVIATGFLVAGPWDFVGHVELREGTVDKEKTRLLDRDDMVSNIVSTFQSLTAHCARCHDHKFDPIPQTDYYRLQAAVAGVERGERPYSEGSSATKARALEAQRKEAARQLETVEARANERAGPELSALDERLRGLRTRLAKVPRTMSDLPSPTNGYHSAIHRAPEAPAWVQVDLGRSLPIDEIRLIPARPTDFRDTPGFGFPPRMLVALSDDPTFPADATDVVETRMRDDDVGQGDEPHVARPEGHHGRYVRVAASRLWNRDNDYVFALAELEVISEQENVALGKPVSALDSIEAGRWSRAALVDGYDSRRKRPAAADPNELQRVELRYQIQRAERERSRLVERAVPARLRLERDALRSRLRALDVALAQERASTGPRVYAAVPRPPRPVFVLARGDVEKPGAAAAPGALSCVPGGSPVFALSDVSSEGARRAALAEWLDRPDNVLTWRSIVNRIWHYHFGRGIVDTPSDFGRNGGRPTHPELLDWLAVTFRDDDRGSLKAMHRRIVTSAAYRQVSTSNPAHAAKDADNRLLWRQNRRRLDAESLRDAVLAATGTLDQRMGGPGFELFRFKDDHSPIYDHTAPGAADNPQVRRRTVYRFTARSVPNPFLECLDSADPNLPVPARTSTITALQALALWNDRFVLSQAGELARRLERDLPDADLGQRLARAFRLTLGRTPTADERGALSAFASRHGLAAACRVLINTNEFVFVD